MNHFLGCLFLMLGSLQLFAGDVAVPKGLVETFDKYSKAWIRADWGRVFDLTSPVNQQALVKEFGTRENWIKHQAANFKDIIVSLERRATHRMSETIYTFAIVTSGKRPEGAPFSVEGFATFEWINEKWFLVDPVLPKAPQPTTKTPKPPQ
jgi:hypothetical protein